MFIGTRITNNSLASAALVACTLLGASRLAAAPPESEEGLTQAQPYVLGPGDLVIVKVFGTEHFDQEARVSNSGRVHVRRLGVIQAAGLTTNLLAEEITQRLRNKELLRDPWVQVAVREMRARPVYILGEVMLPGQFVLKGDMYLVDLLTLTAGLGANAGPTAYLYRRRVAPDQALTSDEASLGRDEVIELNIRGLMEGENLEGNVLLRGGDVVYVPERRVREFFVVGDVVRAGAYEIPEDEEITFSRGVSMAGGPVRTADSGDSVLVRQAGDGRHTEIPINFKRAIAGRDTDPVLEENDIIFVPGSSSKTLGFGMLGMLPSLTQGATQR